MKTSKTIIWIFIVITLFCAPKVFAINADLFPNTNTVQPLPNGSLPNISGNIDWPNVPGDEDSEDSDQDTDNSSSGGSSAEDTNTNQNTPGQTGNNNPTSGQPTDTNATNNNEQTSGNSTSGDSSSNSFFDNFAEFFGFGDSQDKNDSGTSASGTEVNADSSADIQDIIDEGQPQKQKAITESNFAWAIAFSSIILLAAALVLWKLKKSPNDVNPSSK